MNKYYKGMIKAVKNGDKSAEEELLTTLNYIEDLQSQLEQKEDNWNKLKEWLEERKKYYEIIGYVNTKIAFEIVLDKIQEIEGGMNE
jgi:peptidoglycan hydrolase CwlO-like protein